MEHNDNLKRFRKHIVICPHCGKEVLDHMTECMYCKGKLTPKGYTPMLNEKSFKKIRFVAFIALSIIAIALIILKFTK